MSERNYTWVETYKQLAEYLLGNRDKQKYLIDLLRKSGVEVGTDRETPDKRIELTAIGPFTFFSYLNKYGEQRRIEIVRKLAELIKENDNFEIKVPSDFYGVPMSNAQRVWFYGYKYERGENDIDLLWDLFEKVVLDKEITDEQFNKVLQIRYTGKPKITQGFFWIAPERFFPIDKQTRPFLEAMGVEPDFETFSQYLDIVRQLREKTDRPFYELSYDAWAFNHPNFWIFQANPKYYDIEQALKDGSVTAWGVNQYKNEIKKYDKVIIWVTGDKSGIYALAETASFPYLMQPEEMDDLKYYRDKSMIKPGMAVELKITHNLVDSPILEDRIRDNPVLKDLKAGGRGTNFKASHEQYEEILKLVLGEERAKFERVKSKFSKQNFDTFIGFVRKLISEFDIKPEDRNIVFSVYDDSHKGFAIMANNYILSLKFFPVKDEIFGFVADTELKNELPKPQDTYLRNVKAFYNYTSDPVDIERYWDSFKSAAKRSLKIKQSAFI